MRHSLLFRHADSSFQGTYSNLQQLLGPESRLIVGLICADVSVELAVCCLLLGDSEKAEDILGLGPGSSSDQADPAIRSFVMVCTTCFVKHHLLGTAWTMMLSDWWIKVDVQL